MSVVAVGSVRSCGVTTVALGLAATWPGHRRVLLVEADPAGGTLAAASGYPSEPSLVSLAAAMRHNEATELALAHTHLLPSGAAVLTAPAAPGLAGRTLGMLNAMLSNLTALDGDVVLDCGRLEVAGEHATDRGDDGTLGSQTNTDRFLAADVALLVARPQLADLNAIGTFLELPAVAKRRQSGRLRLVLIGEGPYLEIEIEATFEIVVAAHIPFDTSSAQALPTTSAASRELRRAPLIRTLRVLASELAPAPSPAATAPIHAQEKGAAFRGRRRLHVMSAAAPDQL